MPERMTPRLTIAIPTLNRAGLLGRAIESALAQTSPDIEIIVSDNGSTDETPAAIERYAGRGLRLFRHASTMPATKHGQFLVERARGEFFLGLSDDDFLEPEFAAEVLALFDQHPKLSFAYTGCAVHYEDYLVPAVVGPPVETGASFLAAHYAGQREVSWCACVTRVRDLLELGPQPDGCIIGDMFYWTKLAFRGPVGCVPRVLSHYVLLRSQNDNMSHGTPPAIWARESRLLADQVIETSRRQGLEADYIAHLQSDCRRHIGRSTANQFIWCRLRGASRSQAWRWVSDCLTYLSLLSNPTELTRLAAALILPRTMLRRLLLSGAARVAATRGTTKIDNPTREQGLTLARFTSLLGPRNSALRTACRRIAMRFACARHGAHLSFSGQYIDVSKGNRTIRISMQHFPYALDMSRSFEHYFGQIVPISVGGRLVVDYSGPQVHRYAASGLEFELSSFAEEVAAIESYFRWYRPNPGDTVFDLGAYCGVSSYYFSHLVGPTGKVYAFEPDPLNFSLLQRNIARHCLTNVVAVQVAVSDTSGFAEFFSEGALGSTLATHSSRISSGGVTRVKTITFEEACAVYGVPAFAKIDIEGAEVATLAAAAEFIKAHSIHFTLDTNHLVGGKLSNRAVETFFSATGYDVESSDEFGFMTTWARPTNRHGSVLAAKAAV